MFGVALALVASLVALSGAPAPTVEVRTFDFVDQSRTIRLPDGSHVPRPVETIVRYPASGGPYPLIVFGHGYQSRPGTYGRLLDAWTQAGYVVAAPKFPLENADAPGGPDESDLPNQPRDMSFVITRLLALDALPGALLTGKIDPSRIAVAGHSDGAVTALAVAYDARLRDPRVRAAIVLSGARLGGMGAFPRHGPPLLATQGTADPINPPSVTARYFRLAHRPKFLLWLLGASHSPPYTTQGPQLHIVENATLAFLAHYLNGQPLTAFEQSARDPGLTRLTAVP